MGNLWKELGNFLFHHLVTLIDDNNLNVWKLLESEVKTMSSSSQSFVIDLTVKWTIVWDVCLEVWTRSLTECV